MRKLQADRREEVKALAKKHRDRDELVRVKREVASAVVDRGVTEREKLGQAFEHRRDELQRQHEAVRNSLMEQRAKVTLIFTSLPHFYSNAIWEFQAKVALSREFETRLARVDGEVGAQQ